MELSRVVENMDGGARREAHISGRDDGRVVHDQGLAERGKAWRLIGWECGGGGSVSHATPGPAGRRRGGAGGGRASVSHATPLFLARAM